MPVENMQFARVMRELGIQQVYALYSQAKRRANCMLETFQDRLVTKLNLATEAAFDRVMHHSVILEFDVPSYRTNAAQQRGQEKKVNWQI